MPGPGAVPPSSPFIDDAGALSYDAGGLALPTAVTGGNKGAGTINLQHLYVAGTEITPDAALRTFDTVDDMLTFGGYLALTDGALMNLLGYYAALDGAGSPITWTAASQEAIDGIYVFGPQISSFTASFSGDVMTVAVFGSGTPLAVGQNIYSPYLKPGTKIASLGTGTGGAGTYNLSIAVPVDLPVLDMNASTATGRYVREVPRSPILSNYAGIINDAAVDATPGMNRVRSYMRVQPGAIDYLWTPGTDYTPVDDFGDLTDTASHNWFGGVTVPLNVVADGVDLNLSSFQSSPTSQGGFRQEAGYSFRVAQVEAGDEWLTVLNPTTPIPPNCAIGALTIGMKIALTARDLQGHSGYPPNHQQYQTGEIVDIDLVGNRVKISPAAKEQYRIDLPNFNQSVFTGSIATNVLTIASFTSGDGIVAVDDFVAGAGFTTCRITAQLTGSPGSTGTYQLSASVGPISSRSMTAYVNYDVGGPATVFILGGRPNYAPEDSWNVDLTIRGLNPKYASGDWQIYPNGKRVTWTGYTTQNCNVIPSQFGTMRLYPLRTSTDNQLEVDKEGDELWLGGDHKLVIFQSASIQRAFLDAIKVRGALNGSARELYYMPNCNIREDVGPGPIGYGNTERVHVYGPNIISSVGNVDADVSNRDLPNLNNRFALSDLSQSGGDLTFTPDNIANWGVRYAGFFLGGSSSPFLGLTSKLYDPTGVASPGQKIIFRTSFADPIPAAVSGETPEYIVQHPCLDFTIDPGVIGCPQVVTKAIPELAGKPYGSGCYFAPQTFERSFTDAKNLNQIAAWGKLISLWVNVRRPYTGGQSSCLFHPMAKFGAGVFGPAIDRGHFNPIVDATVAGERLITPGAITGAVGADVLTAAAFTASIGPASDTMTVSGVGSGYLNSGQIVTGAGVTAGTTILGQLTGTPGDAGTYKVSVSQTVGSEAMTTFFGSASFASVVNPYLACDESGDQQLEKALIEFKFLTDQGY